MERRCQVNTLPSPPANNERRDGMLDAVKMIEEWLTIEDINLDQLAMMLRAARFTLGEIK